MSPVGTLTGEQIGRLKQLFDAAITLPSTERDDFLRDSTDGDPLLQHELSSLLTAYQESEGYFEKLADEVVRPAVISAIEDRQRDEADPATRTVSHYSLLERVSGGAMGVVYKARDTRLGRTVALKFLPRHHASNPVARERLVAEARAASRLDHPNIGVVYEIGEAGDGQQFIAMAWYDGESLKDLIRREALPVSRAVDVAAQLGDALGAAHAAGIIHRDVKPANVMITSSGAVKLVDFGIAKLMTEGDAEPHSFAGTVAYMSPEQIRGVPLDTRTDIWSLGVVLYEMLAGQRPFHGDTEESLVAAIESEAARPLAGLRPDVPRELRAVIDRCLEKDRNNRYQTADELCNALRAADRNTTIAAIQPQAGSFARNRTLWSGIIAAIVLSAVAIGTLTYVQRNSDSRAASPVGPPVIIGVLPFVDASADDSSRYMADGLSDDLREELGRFAEVSVPSYLSSAPYARSSHSPSSIAREMNARFVVTGDVRQGQRDSRVDARLIDAQTGNAVWSRLYVLSRDRATDIVRSLATDVLSSANVKLNETERNRMGASRIKSPLGYDLYLRGRYAELRAMPRTIFGAISVDDVKRAQAYYTQAKSVDPEFAVVRARLAMTHAVSAATYDTTQARLEQASVEAQIALRLDPQLSELHEVLSTYWKRQKNSQKAIDELETGLVSNPNNVSLLIALAQRYREAGRWEDALARFERAIQLDPRNPIALFGCAAAYGRQRRNGEAMKIFDRLIEVSPDDHEIKLIKGHSYLRWKGSPEVLFEELKSIPDSWDVRGMATFARYTAYRTARRYKDGLAALTRSKTLLSRDGLVYHPISLMRAELYHGVGDESAARQSYDEARRVLEDSVAAHPLDGSIHAALGLTFAGLGRKRPAQREAERAMQLAAANAPNATAFRGLAIETFARIGERDRALQMLELMLTMPSGREVTVPFLRVWPGFDPLRSDPRFGELLERFSVK